MINVTQDLLLWRYKFAYLPTDPEEKICLLRDCLYTGLKVRMFCNSLLVNGDALGKQILNPGVLPMCILHAKMRMCEKLIQQLILTGMHKNLSGSSFKAYCKKVESTVNMDILGRITLHAETGQ